MNIRPKGTVVLPRRVFAGLTLLPWCREVNTALQQLRDRTFTVNATKSTTSSPGSSICQFGELVEIDNDPSPPTTGIKGGIIICGDKTFNVEDYDLSAFTAGTKFVWIEFPVTVNMDDDAELLLPNVDTTSKTEIVAGDWMNDAAYDDITQPVIPTGIGTIILPIGKVITTVDGGDKTFAFLPTGCGNFRVTHCAGTISFQRF